MADAKRILCVGHSALDRIYRIEAFPAQPTKVRALEHIEAGGGMAANAAVAVARLAQRSRSSKLRSLMCSALPIDSISSTINLLDATVIESPQLLST